MPIYEYRCSDCETNFEKLVQSMFSQEAITCPQCGGQHVKKAVSLFGGLGGGGSARTSGGASSQACAPTG